MAIKRIIKRGFISIVVLVTVLFVLFFVAQKVLIVSPPVVEDQMALDLSVVTYNDSLVLCDDSWLHTNHGGISELFIAGSPFDMGVKNGKLTQALAHKQEQYFIGFIKELIPSSSMLNYLKYFIAVFNKDLDEYIPVDLQQEIYGISMFASDEYDFIGEKYHRILNYHAAHDVGHTIQNMNLVNCTAFGVQNELTKDSALLVGRNLDFSAGDDFARQKLVVFCKPDTGYNFSYISWGGMIGVLSGMNEHGLTISLNSAKSGIPVSAKTPVSLISRQVLQFAKTIDEAFEIIRLYDSFVSESFMVASAADNKVVVIEKSLDKTALYDSQQSKTVLTNHFQSKELKDTELNKEAIAEGCTMYRLRRTHQLVDNAGMLDEEGVVNILRDKDGLNNQLIGLGNESAVNQLICHHSVVFNPHKRMMWVSQFPYQENTFLAYDLNSVFSDDFSAKQASVNRIDASIAASDFYNNNGVDTMWNYRAKAKEIKQFIDAERPVDQADLDALLSLNPQYYYTHYLHGLANRNKADKALKAFNKALKCQVPRQVDIEQIENEIRLISNH